MLFNTIWQAQKKLEENSKASRKNTSALEDNSERLHALETEVEQLHVVVQGLWEILKQQGRLQDENLQLKVDEIIKAKEEKSQEKVYCPKCRQTNSSSRMNCIYCGADFGLEKPKGLFR